MTICTSGFNPHPAFLPGDAVDGNDSSRTGRVSIRTRHFCRVMPLAQAISQPTTWCFNPHPAFLPGDAQIPSHAAGLGFHVSIRTRHFCRVMLAIHPRIKATAQVSIRTRHFCRVMLNGCHCGANSLMFQSAPGISAG